ncbi:MAG: cation:proton antiporter [Nitrosopumilus sp.]|nr:cation:proton antiporter [Nitrosopumilus sp.]MDH3516115.1 cation:proton antiporter [Nitrosopumilus sp.]MDH3564602.1 cation:proton antiporter [Nitrosopumilus sp.]MDH5416811.1 cation:proton antiporter [Nitrosopumilus sp.]MDH5554655.1 cation:proton antiporter [Nitrosopumilus sp.]
MAFEAILFIAVLLIAAKLGGELLYRIGQPTILGNVLAGIIVGPAFLAIVHPIEAIELFVSIGVFFLFFLIGLEEIDIAGLFKVMRGKIFAGSAIAFLIPFLVAGVFGLVIDMDFVSAFAIASVIAASSLGVTAKVLSDLGKLKSTIGLEIFTVTAIVEFIAIIFVSVFIQIDTSSELPDITEISWLFAKMILFFAIAGFISVFGLPRFLRLLKNHLRVKQAYFGMVIGVILLIAYFAEISGVHGAIGALLLGIAVSRMSRDEYDEISKNISVVGYGIFIPIFFAGIGLHFSVAFLELEWWIIIIFIIIMTGVKFLSSYIAVRIANMRPATTVAYGVMSKGAVDLALMLSLLQAGIMEDKLFSLLVLGTLMTMIISTVELQRKLKKIIHVKVGTLELGLIPIYFRRVVSDTPVIAVINRIFSKTKSDITIKEFIKNNKITKNPFLVFDKDENLVGLISKNEINKSHKKTRDSTTIADVMYKKFHTALPDEYLFSVIQKMNTHPFDMIPIMDPKNNRKVIGIVTNKGVMELLTDTRNIKSLPK